jgi:hypothetical protein
MQQIYAPSAALRRRLRHLGLQRLPRPHQTKDRPAGGLYINNKGLVTMTRTHKPAFTTVQTFFTQLKSETGR